MIDVLWYNPEKHKVSVDVLSTAEFKLNNDVYTFASMIYGSERVSWSVKHRNVSMVILTPKGDITLEEHAIIKKYFGKYKFNS